MLTLGVLLIAALSFALQQTLVLPALPTIQDQLGASTTATTFVLTAFLLSASVATPIAGRLGDMFGKKRVLVIVLATFGLGSLTCALSQSIEMLIVGRVIQGTGASLYPLAFGIVRDEFPPARVSFGIGIMSANFALGGTLGLALSGVVVDHLAYEWIFWIGLTFVSIGIVTTLLWIPESPIKSPTMIDWGGAGLLSASLVVSLIAISYANSWGWLSAQMAGFSLAALCLFAGWIIYERRQTEPLVDMAMMRRRPVLASNLTSLLVGFGLFGFLILVPQLVQLPTSTGFGLGATATEAGLFMAPMAVGIVVGSPVAGWLGGRIGSKFPLLVGTAVSTGSLALLVLSHEARLSICFTCFTFGLGIGFSFAAMANIIVESVHDSRTSVATGINIIMRTIGGSLGGQLAASVVAAHVAVATGLPDESGFEVALTLCAGGMGLAFLVALSTPRHLEFTHAIPRSPHDGAAVG